MRIYQDPPRRYRRTNIYFDNLKRAKEFDKSAKKEFALKKAQTLEMNLSKPKRNKIKKMRKRKYVFTKQGSQYCLWKELR